MRQESILPVLAGVGFKEQHFDDINSELPDIGWFEVHAENYLGAGGHPHKMLSWLVEHYPLSIHGVGMSIGGGEDIDNEHLDRVVKLCERYNPQAFSEHLAWSTHEGFYLNDLLPLPYDQSTLNTVCMHIDKVQEALNRIMLLENPSTYVTFNKSTWQEVDFIKEVAKRTGCGLLLDVNNVYVSCTNQNIDMHQYIDGFPLHLVGEIHLAGHSELEDDNGKRFLLDSHDQNIDSRVWDLYSYVVEVKKCRVATLLERDDNIPSWQKLYNEIKTAETILLGRAA